MAVSAVISSKCLATETFDEPIVVGRRVTKKFKHREFDIQTTLDANSSPAVSLISAFSVSDTGATYSIDLTALTRSVALADGTTTFDATGKKVIWWRIKNKHASNVIGIYDGNTTPYRLFGSGFVNTTLLPIYSGGHEQGYPKGNLAAVTSLAKIITLGAYTTGGANTTGINADVTILLG